MDRGAGALVARLSRVGFVARGVVYAIIGVLALEAAIGAGGATTDPQGAMIEIAAFPFGDLVLGAAAAGFFGLMVLRALEALFDPEGLGLGIKGVVVRCGYAISSGIFGFLGSTAARLVAFRERPRSSTAEARHWTALAFSDPRGAWLVALVGVGVIGFGLHQLYTGWRATFRAQLDLRSLSPREARWATRSGRIGIGLRGVVFELIGVCLIQAAIRLDPDEVRGLDGALAEMARSRFGPWLLGVMALGFLAFAVYSVVEALYRRIPARPRAELRSSP